MKDWIWLLQGTLSGIAAACRRIPGPLLPKYFWLASASLAVTFPFLIFHTEFFELWPLKRAEKMQQIKTARVAAG